MYDNLSGGHENGPDFADDGKTSLRHPGKKEDKVRIANYMLTFSRCQSNFPILPAKPSPGG
jgi:hypothetical protein